MMRASLMLGAVTAVLACDYSCPSASFGLHAQCQVTATVNAACAEVQEEVIARIQGNNGWTDPHNGGFYSVMSRTADVINGKRLTGNKKYTDHFTMQFEGTGNTCSVVSCSRSQAFSVLDFSTNYCNVHNLYCGTQYGCKFVKYNFHVEESFGLCLQHHSPACIV